MSNTHTRRRVIAPMILAACALSSACASQSASLELAPMVTDRPDFTESALTVPVRSQQLEFGQTFAQEGETQTVAIGEFLLRSGLSDRIEMRLAANSFAIEQTGTTRAQGMEDANIGAKIALREAGEGSARWQPGLAMIVGASVPTGARVFRSDRVLPEVKLLAAWDLTDRVAFSSNLNWARAEQSGASYTEWSGSASFGAGVTDRVGAYLEYYAFGEATSAWRRREYVNGGLTYLFTPSLQLDARAGIGPSAGQRDFFAGLGLSRRW